MLFLLITLKSLIAKLFEDQLYNSLTENIILLLKLLS